MFSGTVHVQNKYKDVLWSVVASLVKTLFQNFTHIVNLEFDNVCWNFTSIVGLESDNSNVAMILVLG